MRPNLKPYDITSLTASFVLTFSEDLIAQIREASPPDDDGDSVFLDSYKVDNVSHRASVWVMELDKDVGSFRVGLRYELGKGGRLRKDMPRINKIFDILASIEEQINIDCQVIFTFERRQRIKPIIPLPMKLIESPDMPFDEIAGVHLVKRIEERERHDVVLGISTGGVLFENIFFEHRASIQERLVDDIVGQAVEISNRFVSKGE